MAKELCYCGNTAFYCLRHTNICTNCFISSIHKKIKHNISFVKYPQSIIIEHSKSKYFYVILNSIKSIYHSKSNKFFFILENKEFKPMFGGELTVNRTILNFFTVNSLVLNGLVGLLEGKGRIILEGLNEDYVVNDVQYLNVLKGITNEEINLYFEVLGDNGLPIEESSKDKLESVCEEFLNELEERNYSALISFYKTLKKI